MSNAAWDALGVAADALDVDAMDVTHDVCRSVVRNFIGRNIKRYWTSPFRKTG